MALLSWDDIILFIPLHATNHGHKVFFQGFLDGISIIPFVPKYPSIPFPPYAPHFHSRKGLPQGMNDSIHEGFGISVLQYLSYLPSPSVAPSKL